MYKIIRWTAYALTLIGAILIIMAIVGGCRYHWHYVHAHGQTCCMMQQHCGNMPVAKKDTANAKMQAMGTNMPMHVGKQDSANWGKKQMMCPAGPPMFCNSCQMYHQHIGFHMGLAICFLLLAIALLMINSQCRCKKCCECKDGKCECKEEKKE